MYMNENNSWTPVGYGLSYDSSVDALNIVYDSDNWNHVANHLYLVPRASAGVEAECGFDRPYEPVARISPTGRRFTINSASDRPKREKRKDYRCGGPVKPPA